MPPMGGMPRPSGPPLQPPGMRGMVPPPQQPGMAHPPMPGMLPQLGMQHPQHPGMPPSPGAAAGMHPRPPMPGMMPSPTSASATKIDPAQIPRPMPFAIPTQVRSVDATLVGHAPSGVLPCIDRCNNVFPPPGWQPPPFPAAMLPLPFC